MTQPLGHEVLLAQPFDEALARVRAALKVEGFGILTEIDLRQAFREKLGREFRPYVILGACNPPLAHAALTAERDIGLLLPCNVIVYAGDDGCTSVVAAMDPVAALSLTGNSEIRPLAEDVRGRLQRVLDAVAATQRQGDDTKA